MTAQCSPSPPATVEGVLLGGVLALATFLLPFPQAFKLLKHRSSAGLSPLTLCVSVLYAGTNVSSTVVVKWHQFEACAHGAACVANLLDLLQQVAAWVTWMMVALICVSLPPNRQARPATAAALSIAATLGLVAGAVAKSLASPCGAPALAYSQALAIVGGVWAAIQFAPQLAETWRHGSAGSLSYVTYAIQTVGSVAVIVNQTVVAQDPWPVWAPQVLSTSMQGAVLFLALWLRRFPRRAALGAAAAVGVAPDGGALPPTVNAALLANAAPVGGEADIADK